MNWVIDSFDSAPFEHLTDAGETASVKPYHRIHFPESNPVILAYFGMKNLKTISRQDESHHVSLLATELTKVREELEKVDEPLDAVDLLAKLTRKRDVRSIEID